MEKSPARLNWLLIAVYLLLSGGVSAMTVYAAVESGLHPALSIVFLFAVLGGIALAFLLYDGGKGWRWVTAINWVAAAITLLVYFMVDGLLHPAIGSALFLFIAAGALLYLAQGRKERDPRALDKPQGR